MNNRPNSIVFAVFLLILITILGGCATRPGPNVLRVVPALEADSGASSIPIYMATSRALAAMPAVEQGGSLYFTEHRSPETLYARYLISVPPSHRQAVINWPLNDSAPPDPHKHFAVVEAELLERKEFMDSVGARSRKTGKIVKSQSVGVFIHGFNTNFPEALFRITQMSADITEDGQAILFTWPSQGRFSGYLADRESVLYSRDHLVGLLKDLAAAPQVDNITLVAHSMGAWLATEALRQLKLEGKNNVLDQIRVILAMPDISVDLFRQEVELIGPMKHPMILLVSPDDRALWLSRFLSSTQRIGTLDVYDPRIQKAAASADIKIIDVSQLPATDRINHNRYVNIAALMPELLKDVRKQQTRDSGLSSAGAFIFDAVSTTLLTPLDFIANTLEGNAR